MQELINKHYVKRRRTENSSDVLKNLLEKNRERLFKRESNLRARLRRLESEQN